MDSRVKDLLDAGDRLFDRPTLMNFWQEVALNFFPEMADFTSKISISDRIADNLTTSYPVLARRSLGDALSALLRPVSLDSPSPGVWFSIAVPGVDDVQSLKWLKWATGVQRRAMYDRKARFVRATKEGDHSFVSFGQAPLSLELSRDGSRLLYRCHHLKDVAWEQDAEGDFNHVQRKWHPTATQLMATFGDKVSAKVKDLAKKEPGKTVKCRHIVIAADEYERRGAAGKKFRTPWVSVWVDEENEAVLEEVGSWSRTYIIPQFVTVPGSQYAISPAVVAAMPDGRLIQAMTLTILEAAEKNADPPMVATQEVVRSDINLFSGGITWVDREYDEKTGEALRPLVNPKSGEGMATAFNLRNDTRDQIAKAFFLDSLSLPPANVKEMTAFEVGTRISEWIRRAMPIFEPMEFEYNGALCEETFDLLMRNGAFGSRRDIPEALKGKDIQFKFESPLHESSERRKGQRFIEAQQILAQAATMDQSVIAKLDVGKAMDDILKSYGTVDWMRDQGEIDAMNAASAQQAQAANMMAGVGGMAEIAKNVGSAVKDFAGARGMNG